jgi:general secretion pathway protein K
VTRARAERGVAVVMAVLVVALATSSATYLLWQQSLWVRQVENLTGRAQADAIARAAASWAATILGEDDPALDHLGEPWARRVPAFAAEQAQVAGALADEQAKFNVNNLARDGGAAPHDFVAFQRLLTALGLPAELAEAVLDWLDADGEAMQPNGAEDPYYLALDPPYRTAGRRVADLAELVRVRGFDADILARLAPFVTALPEETPVNVNTAPVEVLQALMPGLGREEMARVIAQRKTRPFQSRDDFLRALARPPAESVGAQLDVKSRYFSAETTVRSGRVTVAYRALFQRRDQRLPALVQVSHVAI